MAAPLGVSVAFGDNALTANPAWTRLDNPAGYNLVRSWTIDRGRSSELDKTQTGIAEVTFIPDKAGMLDPTKTSGPFSSGGVTQVDPMRQAAIALQNPVTGSWYTL